MKALGVHIYAGGFTAGVSRHFDVKAVFEDTGYGSSTHRLNFPDVPIHVSKPWPVFKEEYGGIDWLYSNPPCAIFSALGSRIGRGADQWRLDKRVGCWMDCFSLVPDMKPRAFALESVTQAYTVGRELVDELTQKALLLGYSVSHVLINAKWMGVPQSRNRFFLVLHKPPIFRTFPLNWAPPPTIGETLAEVTELGEIPPHRNPDLVAQMYQGEQGVKAFDRLNPPEKRTEADFNDDGSVRGRPRLGDCRAQSDGIIGAFTGAACIHPTEDRHLSVEEMKRICGFPDWFRFDAQPKDVPSLLARGVLPPVAEWLARSIKETLEYPDGTWADRRVTRVDRREPDVKDVDVTRAYLDDHGRVRIRLKADGTTVPVVRDGPTKRDLRVGGVSRTSGGPRGSSRPSIRSGPNTRESRHGRTYTPAFIPEPPVIRSEDAPPPLRGESSGSYICRHLLAEGFSDPDLLAGWVRALYPGHTTTRREVYLQYRKLEDEGVEGLPPAWFQRRASRKMQPIRADEVR